MLHDEKAGYKPAEFEKIMPPIGFNDITRGMYELFTPLAKSKDGLPSGTNPLSWRVLPADVLPAPGVCVTEQANIYIAHDLTAGMTLADFRRVDFYLRFARVVGIPLHEIAHWLFSPDDWRSWVKRMSRHGKHIGVLCVLLEEPRIENQLLQTHYRGLIPGPVGFDNTSRRRVTGLMTDEMVAAMHATSDEHMSRNVAQSGEEGESGLTTNYFNKAMILVYGRVVGGSAMETPGSLTANAVLTLRAVVAEAMEAKFAETLANGGMTDEDIAEQVDQWWGRATRLLQEAVWLANPENQWKVAQWWSDHVKQLELPKSMPEPPPPPSDEDDPGTTQADPGDTTPPEGEDEEPGQDGQEQGQEPSEGDSGPGDPDDDTEPQGGSEGSDGDDEDAEESESDDPSTGTGEPGDSEEGDEPSDDDSDDSGTGDGSIESEDGDEQGESDDESSQKQKLGDNDKGGSALNDLKDLIEQMRENGQDESHDFEDDKSEEQQEAESETATAALEKVQIKRGEVANTRRTHRASANAAWNGRRSF